MNIIGIYLAAGQSKRMGRNKLLLDIGGRHLGSFALNTALESLLDYVLVVTKMNDSLLWVDTGLFPKSHKRKWRKVPSKDSYRGQSHSIKTGLEEAIRMKADAVIILLADQPLLTVNMVNVLIQAYKNNKSKEVIGYSFRGAVHPPILFSRKLFPQLLELQGDVGARKLIRKIDSEKVILYESQKEKCFFDVDTPEDLESLKGYELEISKKKPF